MDTEPSPNVRPHTPNGLSVIVRHLLISLLSDSGSGWVSPVRMPNPPAFDTADWVLSSNALMPFLALSVTEAFWGVGLRRWTGGRHATVHRCRSSAQCVRFKKRTPLSKYTFEMDECIFQPKFRNAVAKPRLNVTLEPHLRAPLGVAVGCYIKHCFGAYFA